MKKKIILGALILAMLLVFVGCGTKDTKVKGNTNKFDGYTILEDKNESFSLKEYLVYDNDTYIMYTFCETYGGVYVKCPYYVMNENNEPIIGVYNGDEEWEE